MSRNQRLALLGVLGVVLALRLAWVTPGRDFGDLFHFDMTWYLVTASQIADGNGVVRLSGEPTAFWPPGYPAFLAAVFVATDPVLGSEMRIAAARVTQALLGAITCLICFLIGQRLFGAWVGILAAALLATSPDHIMYSDLLMTESVFTFLMSGFVLLFVLWTEKAPFPSPLRCLALGAALAPATLVRGTALLIPSALFATWVLTSRSFRKSLTHTLLVAGALLLCLLPWAFRNTVQLGSPVLVDTHIGDVLQLTHSPLATGGNTIRGYETNPAGAMAYQEQIDAYRIRLEHLPWPEREVAEMRAEVGRALEYMGANPGRVMELVPARIGWLYEHGHASMLWGRVPGEPLVGWATDRVLASAADLHFFVVLLLSLAGAWLAVRRAVAGAVLLPMLVLYVTALHGLLFLGLPRFHAPLLPILSVLAALPLVASAGDRRTEGVGSGP